MCSFTPVKLWVVFSVSHLSITEAGLEYEVLLMFCSFLVNPTPFCLSYSTRSIAQRMCREKVKEAIQ